MARIRTIKPEFWGDPKTARVSRDARLLFLGLLNESDDEGRQLGTTKRIAGVVFPNDDDVTESMVDCWLRELEQVELVRRYVVNKVVYVLICGFVEHQKISHASPSRLPSPSDELRESLRYSSGVPPEFLRPDLGIDLGSGSRIIAPKNGAKKKSRTTRREPDPLWEALLDACGIPADGITTSARGAYNRALKELRDAGATEQAIRARAAMHRAKWPQSSLTPSSLAKHWAELAGPPRGAVATVGPRPEFKAEIAVDNEF